MVRARAGQALCLDGGGEGALSECGPPGSRGARSPGQAATPARERLQSRRRHERAGQEPRQSRWWLRFRACLGLCLATAVPGGERSPRRRALGRAAARGAACEQHHARRHGSRVWRRRVQGLPLDAGWAPPPCRGGCGSARIASSATHQALRGLQQARHLVDGAASRKVQVLAKLGAQVHKPGTSMLRNIPRRTMLRDTLAMR